VSEETDAALVALAGVECWQCYGTASFIWFCNACKGWHPACRIHSAGTRRAVPFPAALLGVEPLGRQTWSSAQVDEATAQKNTFAT